VIRVEITARHRQVLMASHTLEKVQLDAGVGHPDQRRVSQGGPLLARTVEAVSRSSVARSGSMIGAGRHRRPLVSLVTRPLVRLPPHGQEPMREVDVTNLQAGHLTDP
jgi:hypothetical protein